tara:strand:- start:163 stop:663 length:501 start_codon:yes stop_codon:yes gene_type:complete
MNLTEAHNLAESLIHKYLTRPEVHQHNWKFKFSNSKCSFGTCEWGRNVKLIELSKPLTELNSKEEVLDTILHEIAHALDFQIRGFSNHDYIWRKIAKGIGCNGERCYDRNTVNLPEAKYTLKCNGCEKTTTRHRKPKRGMACGSCCRKHNNGRYSSDYIFDIKKNF